MNSTKIDVTGWDAGKLQRFIDTVCVFGHADGGQYEKDELTNREFLSIFYMAQRNDENVWKIAKRKC